MNDKAVMIEIRGDIRDINAKLAGLNREFKQTASETKRASDSMAAGFTSLAAKVAGFAAGFVSIRSAIEVFKEFEKTAFTMKATFGAAADHMAQKARTMSEGTIYHTNEVSYAFTKTTDSMQRYGITGEKYIGLVQRAMDVGASKGLELKESIDRIESAMRGEAEASEYLGVTLNDTYMKNIAFNGALQDQWETLSDTEKALYRYQELMAQTEKYTGKAAEATQTLSGQAREFGNELKDNVYFWLEKTNTMLGQLASEKNKGFLKELTGMLRESRGFWDNVFSGNERVMLGGKQIAGPTGAPIVRKPIVYPPSGPAPSGGVRGKSSKGTKKGKAASAMDEHVQAYYSYHAESEELARRYAEEFEIAKNGLSDLDVALAGTEGQLSQMRDQHKKTMEDIGKTTTDVAKEMGDSMSTFFYDVFMGRIRDINDALRSIGSMIAAAAVRWATVQAGTAFATLFHSGGVVGAGAGSSVAVPASVFTFAPRLHNGLRPGEFPAILEKGETVLPKGMGGGGQYNFYINAVDPQSFAEYCNRNPGAIIGPVAKNIAQNGMLRSVIRTYGR